MDRFLYGVGFATFVAALSFAQGTGEQPRFEVASVKPAPPGARRISMDGGPLPAGPFNISGSDPGRITWANVRLKRMIQVAYDFPLDRISGPDWFDTQGYDVVATIPTGTTVSDFRRMVQNLLAERFKLTVHRETKEVAGYALEIAKNGPKINASKDDAAVAAAAAKDTKSNSDKACEGCNALVVVDSSGYPAPRPGNLYYPPGAEFEATIRVNGRLRATLLNARISNIADFLHGFAGAPVQDQTGLTGKYDLHLEWSPNVLEATAKGDAPAATNPVTSDPGPDIFAAVQIQLGLRLVPKKVPVEKLVADHAEKIPTEN